jgi:hypothetical protein
MVEDFNLDDFNMLGMNAKKVLIVLSIRIRTRPIGKR